MRIAATLAMLSTAATVAKNRKKNVLLFALEFFTSVSLYTILLKMQINSAAFVQMTLTLSFERRKEVSAPEKCHFRSLPFSIKARKRRTQNKNERKQKPCFCLRTP
jgi:hypothetical protein